MDIVLREGHLKVKDAHQHAPNRAEKRRLEVRERGGLLLLWLGVLCSGFALLPETLAEGEGEVIWRQLRSAFGWGGAICAGLLLLRVVLSGFTGYERSVGLRIIRRDRSGPRARRWLFISWGAAVVGIALLLLLQRVVGVSQWDSAAATLLSSFRLFLVVAVSLGTFLGLLLLIGQRFSLFGTTSIFGIVLGVSALLVVQSVATGFQHEFERRVLGVYAHVNVTRAFGISEYRRFETWLRTLDGVEGASPFVYYAMALARYDPEDADEGSRRLASVLVKGIEPKSADEVMDLREHLERHSGKEIPIAALKSNYTLMPVLDRPAERLPGVVLNTPDPRGEGWYARAMADWNASRAGKKEELRRDHEREQNWGTDESSEWADPPEFETSSFSGKIDPTTLPTMFVGAALAKELELAEGDIVRLVDPGATFDHSEEPKFSYYLVAGVFQAGFQEYDSRLVYVNIKELQRFKYRDKDIVSGVDLRLEDQDMASSIGAEVRERLGEEYSVLEWHKLNENLFSSIRTQKNIITIILSLVIVVASSNVATALLTMVMRRTPEVAILMSMGGTGAQIARIFQATGMTIGLAGSVAGVIFGLVNCWLVELYGYTLDPEVYFIESLPVEVQPLQVVWILGLALLICFVATLPPSLRAASLRPVEGLRAE